MFRDGGRVLTIELVGGPEDGKRVELTAPLPVHYRIPVPVDPDKARGVDPKEFVFETLIYSAVAGAYSGDGKAYRYHWQTTYLTRRPGENFTAYGRRLEAWREQPRQPQRFRRMVTEGEPGDGFGEGLDGPIKT